MQTLPTGTVCRSWKKTKVKSKERQKAECWQNFFSVYPLRQIRTAANPLPTASAQHYDRHLQPRAPRPLREKPENQTHDVKEGWSSEDPEWGGQICSSVILPPSPALHFFKPSLIVGYLQLGVFPATSSLTFFIRTDLSVGPIFSLSSVAKIRILAANPEKSCQVDRRDQKPL